MCSRFFIGLDNLNRLLFFNQHALPVRFYGQAD